MSVYRLLRAANWSLTGYPAKRIKAFLLRSQRWTRDQLLDYRDERLRQLLTHCYDNVPYYRRVMDQTGLRPQDIRGAGDLHKLPLLTKADIRANAQDLLARRSSDMHVSWTRTGGTTGEPMRVAKDRLCSAWENMCYERGLEWGGLRPQDIRVSLFGGSLGIDKTNWTGRLGHLVRRDVFLPAFELRRDTAPGFFSKVRRSGARHIVGYASSLYRFAQLAQELAPDVTFKAAFPTAELLLPEWEELIGRVFRCDVLPYYGCGEVNSLGYSVHEDDSRSYAIPEEQCLIEVLDQHGRTAIQGDGRFVLTSLVNYAMPILRYCNGDSGNIAGPTGTLPFSRIQRLDGRYNSFLLTDTGDLISGVIGTHIFRHLTSAVETYRIIQQEPLQVLVKVVPKDQQFSGRDETLIKDLLGKHLGRRVRITIETVRSIPAPPSGKAVFVINHCLGDRHPAPSSGGDPPT
jgi:phenylacetate-CoA ligase